MITVHGETVSLSLASLTIRGGMCTSMKPDDPRVDLESSSLRDRFLMILGGSDTFSHITVMKYNKKDSNEVTDVSGIFRNLEASVQGICVSGADFNGEKGAVFGGVYSY